MKPNQILTILSSNKSKQNNLKPASPKQTTLFKNSIKIFQKIKPRNPEEASAFKDPEYRNIISFKVNLKKH